jgi:hypothetical protein
MLADLLVSLEHCRKTGFTPVHVIVHDINLPELRKDLSESLGAKGGVESLSHYGLTLHTIYHAGGCPSFLLFDKDWTLFDTHLAIQERHSLEVLAIRETDELHERAMEAETDVAVLRRITKRWWYRLFSFLGMA